MASPKTKEELIVAMADSYIKLNEQISKMTSEELNAQFQFASDPKKCGARWIYDRCARDLLIHLHEWQVLMREFVGNICNGAATLQILTFAKCDGPVPLELGGKEEQSHPTCSIWGLLATGSEVHSS